MDPESIPGLVQRFDLNFPGERLGGLRMLTPLSG
jgi:hypothetical protein